MASASAPARPAPWGRAVVLGLCASLALGEPTLPGVAHGDPGPGVRLVSRSLVERGRKPDYTIEVHYPQIVGPRDASQRKFNREVAAFVQRRAREFKRHLGAATPEPPVPDAPSSLDVGYVVGVASRGLISLGFEANTYFSGAVHPNHEMLAFTYDLRADRRLDLGDLFAPGTAYLDVIARFCVEALARQVSPPPDRAWIRRGAAPTADNYRRWIVTEQGLKIFFDPYQVAPYVDGLQEVTVPYRVIDGLIGGRSPLADLAAARAPH